LKKVSYSASQEIFRHLWNQKLLAGLTTARRWTLSSERRIKSTPSLTIHL